MYCKQCGKELKEGENICENCGTQNVEEVKENANKNNQFLEKLKTNKKMQYSLIGIIAAIVVLIIILAAYQQSKKTINLEDYVKIEFSGYNTKGTARIDFDEEQFTKDVMAVAKNVNQEDSWKSLVDYYLLKESCSMDLDKSTELSNGDKVTLTFTYNNSNLKAYGIKFKGDKVTEKVKGLDDLKTVDPFEDIDVEFSGVDGEVTAEVVNNSKDDYLKHVSYSLDKNTNIKIGDKVTVKVDVSEETAENNGFKFKETQKTFTCENADKYVETLSQIDEKSLEEFQKQSIDIINSELGTDTDFVMGELNFEGMYLLNSKDPEGSWSAPNALYVVYSTTITNAEGVESFSPQTVYLPVSYDTVLVTEDGSITSDLQDGTLISKYNSIEGTWLACYNGYFSGTEMYNDIIKSNLAEYTYEVSEDLQQFGN